MKRAVRIVLVVVSSVMLSHAAYPAESDDELIKAAKNCDIQKVNELLAAGAEVDLRSSAGRTPLMGAAYYGNADTVKYLIKAGADIHARSNTGDTALSLATSSNQREVAELLRNAVSNKYKGKFP